MSIFSDEIEKVLSLTVGIVIGLVAGLIIIQFTLKDYHILNDSFQCTRWVNVTENPITQQCKQWSKKEK